MRIKLGHLWYHDKLWWTVTFGQDTMRLASWPEAHTVVWDLQIQLKLTAKGIQFSNRNFRAARDHFK